MKNTAGTIVFSLAFGSMQGAFVSLLPACVHPFSSWNDEANLFPLLSSIAALTTDMNTIGIRMAMAFLGQSIAALVGTPIAGYIIGQNPGEKGYVGAGVYSGCTVLFGVAILAYVRMRLAAERGTKWV
jgi:hypothetical protein